MIANFVRALVSVCIASICFGCSPSTKTKQDTRSPTGLESEVRGTGEAILLIHGAYIEDALLSLSNEPALGKYRVIRYHRRGYGNSARHALPLSIAGEAQDALGLLQSLGIERAHVVGYSSGGLIALELALSAPQVVSSLILIEPPFNVEVGGSFPMADFLGAALALYNGGDKAGATNFFLGEVFGPAWREELPRMVAGGLEQVETNTDLFFRSEMHAVLAYTFPPTKARIPQPVLLILSSEESSQAAYIQALMTWLPQTQQFVVADANHNLPMKQPRSIAERLAAFLSSSNVVGNLYS